MAPNERNAAPSGDDNNDGSRKAEAGSAEADQYTCLRTKDDGTVCGAKMKNHPRNISSHNSTKHRGDSAYKKKSASERRMPCTFHGCSGTYKNFHSLLDHVRIRHQFRGISAELRAASEKKMAEGEDGEEESGGKGDGDGDGWIPLPDDKHGNSTYDNNGPPGVGGAQATTVC